MIQFDDNCDDAKEDSATLLEKVVALTKLSSANLEDSSIATASTEIISLTSSITVISLEQKATIITLISTIKSTVLVYVSQISIVESSKLEIAGALKFPGATNTIDNVDENNFAEQTTVLKAQLTNLFKVTVSKSFLVCILCSRLRTLTTR